MLSFLRATPPTPRTSTHDQSKIDYEDSLSSQHFHGPTSEYFVTHTLPPARTPSFFAPPLHYHVSQAETFRVVSGTGRFVLDGGEVLVKEGDSITIPVRAYHRFENGDRDEALVVDIKLDPNKYEMEERFFRNFFGYLDDCRRAKLEPSLWQLLRFLEAAETPLALPVPGWVPSGVRNWVDWGFVKVGGVVVGEWLLGYQSSYKEYYQAKGA